MNRKELIEYATMLRGSATLNFVRAIYYHFAGDKVEERIYLSGAVANALNWQRYLKQLFQQMDDEVRSQPWPRSSEEEQRTSKPTVEGSNPSGVANFTEEEVALGIRMFMLQPDSPWTAFCELREYFDMPLERKQDLFDFCAKRIGYQP